MSSRNAVLYTRKSCQLCDEAKEILEMYGFSIHEIDIDTQPKLLEKYDIKSYNQLPLILKTDPVAMFLGMKRGDICQITAPSETSGEYISYRYCQ